MNIRLVTSVARVCAPALALCAAAAMVIPACRRMAHVSALETVTIAAAASPQNFAARIVAPSRSTLAALGATSGRGFALAAALETARKNPSPESQHAAGIALLLNNFPADAIEHLSKAAREKNDAVYWTHLAAGHYALGVKEGSADQLLSSLGASSHALRLDGSRHEAAYNFALAVERLGARAAAQELWKQYVARAEHDAWRDEAQRHISRLSRSISDRDAWLGVLEQERPSMSEAAAAYPQQARTWSEVEFLAQWAAAMKQGDPRSADAVLAKTRVVGETLRRTSGESLLYDTILSIDRARGEMRRLQALVDAHLRYRQAMQLLRDQRVREAFEEFERSRRSFIAGDSPMSILAAAYAASALQDADRFDEARTRLDELVEDDAAHLNHHAARAQIRYQRARLDSIEGYLSDSLEESTEAMALYHRIGERGNEGMTAVLIAEGYDFAGQPTLAIEHGTNAIPLLAAAGDVYRLRVAAAILCRAFIRRNLFDTAYALIRLERSLEPVAADPVVTADTLIRAGIIEHSLARSGAAERELADAAETAQAIPDEELRASVMSDVSAARGALMRRRNPAASAALLTEAIDYLERTDRAIQLPQVYLERGRAQIDRGELKPAAEDFARGIEHLERQRSHAQAAIRYSIFDDAHDLFSEAVALQLRLSDREQAFRMLERGRARALLEQIAGAPAISTQPQTLRSVQQHLPPRTLLIEYAVLRDRVILFLIAEDLIAVREVVIDSRLLTAKLDAFTEALVSRRPLSEIQKLAGELHGVLIDPAPERFHYQQLVVVPDGLLQQLPFIALYDRRHRRFLVQDHIVVESPSAAVFLQSRAHTARLRRPRTPTATVVIGARGTASMPLRPLPELEREAGLVAAIYEQSTLLRGPDATITRFLAESERHDVVHFGGHALLDNVDPTHSALVLTPENDRHSGLLDCRSIGAAPMRRTRVVVLAACSTMRGRTSRVEGTPSIARSFLAAGVPTVIGTLWDIDDAETAEFVADLHRHIAAGLPTAIALRNAQLKALESPYPETRHPGAWAAFAVLGSGDL